MDGRFRSVKSQKKTAPNPKIATPLKPHHILQLFLQGQVRLPGMGQNQ
jgi:hypothetical protein